MGLLWFGVLLFSLWMFLDCATHDVKEKTFWAILIIGTGPIGSVIYASKRSTLIGETVKIVQSPQGTIMVPSSLPASRSSQIIKGIGITIGVVLGVGGLLVVGFIVLIGLMLSSGGGNYGSSK
jgi:hypothetical protein